MFNHRTILATIALLWYIFARSVCPDALTWIVCTVPLYRTIVFVVYALIGPFVHIIGAAFATVLAYVNPLCCSRIWLFKPEVNRVWKVRMACLVWASFAIAAWQAHSIVTVYDTREDVSTWLKVIGTMHAGPVGYKYTKMCFENSISIMDEDDPMNYEVQLWCVRNTLDTTMVEWFFFFALNASLLYCAHQGKMTMEYATRILLFSCAVHGKIWTSLFVHFMQRCAPMASLVLFFRERCVLGYVIAMSSVYLFTVYWSGSLCFNSVMKAVVDSWNRSGQSRDEYNLPGELCTREEWMNMSVLTRWILSMMGLFDQYSDGNDNVTSVKVSKEFLYFADRLIVAVQLIGLVFGVHVLLEVCNLMGKGTDSFHERVLKMVPWLGGFSDLFAFQFLGELLLVGMRRADPGSIPDLVFGLRRLRSTTVFVSYVNNTFGLRDGMQRSRAVMLIAFWLLSTEDLPLCWIGLYEFLVFSKTLLFPSVPDAEMFYYRQKAEHWVRTFFGQCSGSFKGFIQTKSGNLNFHILAEYAMVRENHPNLTCKQAYVVAWSVAALRVHIVQAEMMEKCRADGSQLLTSVLPKHRVAQVPREKDKENLRIGLAYMMVRVAIHSMDGYAGYSKQFMNFIFLHLVVEGKGYKKPEACVVDSYLEPLSYRDAVNEFFDWDSRRQMLAAMMEGDFPVKRELKLFLKRTLDARSIDALKSLGVDVTDWRDSESYLQDPVELEFDEPVKDAEGGAMTNAIFTWLAWSLAKVSICTSLLWSVLCACTVYAGGLVKAFGECMEGRRQQAAAGGGAQAANDAQQAPPPAVHPVVHAALPPVQQMLLPAVHPVQQMLPRSVQGSQGALVQHQNNAKSQKVSNVGSEISGSGRRQGDGRQIQGLKPIKLTNPQQSKVQDAQCQAEQARQDPIPCIDVSSRVKRKREEEEEEVGSDSLAVGNNVIRTGMRVRASFTSGRSSTVTKDFNGTILFFRTDAKRQQIVVINFDDEPTKNRVYKPEVALEMVECFKETLGNRSS
jgi:hypothetical protein